MVRIVEHLDSFPIMTSRWRKEWRHRRRVSLLALINTLMASISSVWGAPGGALSSSKELLCSLTRSDEAFDIVTPPPNSWNVEHLHKFYP
jgi:hypothetical protein